jgi:SWI/SNF-related matrix-associated actin-dependent regulator 1 of chromatin subfamily A
MLITAKFPSSCTKCGKLVAAGDRVSWTKGVRGVMHAVCSDEGKVVKEAVETSRATDADINIPVPEGLSFLPYQKAGIAYALKRNGTIFGDEMGLGKTVQAIGLVNADETIRTVLVICPKSLKYNWRNEFNKWSSRPLDLFLFPEQALVFSELFPGQVRVVICHYDQLSKLQLFQWDLVITDEAQFIKNEKAQRSKKTKEHAKRAKKKILLTGTPIPNRIKELWHLLQIVDPETWDPPGFAKGRPVGAGEGAGWMRFAKRYCDAKQVVHNRKGESHWDFDGASNLEELNEKLRASCLVRRLKRDVLKDLPAKRRQIITLKAPVCADEKHEWERLNLSYEDAIEILSRDRLAFTELSVARHKTALAKVPATVEFLNDLLADNDGKLIVFAHHLDVIDELERGLFGHGVVTITSATEAEFRQRHVEMFQNDPGTRVIIGTIGAMGTGHTLTASSTVVMVESSWTPSDNSQCEDRAHRIGQKDSVNVLILVSDGSVDANIMHTVIAKQEVADLALDVDTFGDISDRPLVAVKEEPKVDPIEMGRTLAQLKYLSDRCDGAHEKDEKGFNALDTNFGKQLARLNKLSPRQLSAAKAMLVKYQRQLGDWSWYQ